MKRDDPLFVAKVTMLGGVVLGVTFVVLRVTGLVPGSLVLDALLSLVVTSVFLFSGSS